MSDYELSEDEPFDDGPMCENCFRSVRNNKWSKIRAYEAGWFMKRDGKTYCPDHIPDWAVKWSNERQERREAEQRRKMGDKPDA